MSDPLTALAERLHAVGVLARFGEELRDLHPERARALSEHLDWLRDHIERRGADHRIGFEFVQRAGGFADANAEWVGRAIRESVEAAGHVIARR